MLVLLLWPLSLLEESELAGGVPEGVVVVSVPLDELEGVAEVPVGLLIVDEDGDVDVEPGLVVLPVDGVVVVVVLDVVEVVSVVGAAGGSDFLQAPSATKAAARATHLIEMRMFTPTVWGQCGDGARPASRAASVIDGTACRRCPKGWK